MGKWRLGIIATTLVVAGCSLLTDLTGLSGGALSTTGPDAAPEAASGGDAGVDAYVPSDASSDVDASSPCGTTPAAPLVGSNDLASTVDDGLAPGVFDTYGYLAAKDGTARCAWLYVSRVPVSGAFAMAVYSNVAATNDPGSLLAVAHLSGVAMGWNAALLDKPVTVGAGQTLWLGLATEGEGGAVRPLEGCSTPLSNHVGDGPGAVPRDPFVLLDEYPTNCNAAAYLSP